MTYEYKIVPAPERGEKGRGLKTPEARFAAAIERVINEMAAQGWEYQRADALPSEERSGLTHTQTVWRHLLVFRRGTAAAQAGIPAKRPAPPAQLGAAQAEAAQADVAQAKPVQADPPAPAAAQAPVADEAPESETAEAETEAPQAGAPRRLTATREAPLHKRRIAPPREDPAIAAPVRKLFAGAPRAHSVETHPNDPVLTRGKSGRRDDDRD